MTPQAFIFIGRYGSGKGTQSQLLIEALRAADPGRTTLYMQTGQQLREFIRGDSRTARNVADIMNGGGLLPEFVPVYLWAKYIVERYSGNEHIVFDGTPRKVLEAKLLEGIFPFYSMNKPWVIYLDVEHEESHRRLQIRSRQSGRADDGAKEIEVRRTAYEADVVPTIEWYRSNPAVRFLDIDGERTIEEIHKDIIARVGVVGGNL